jgi:hypothetical protein
MPDKWEMLVIDTINKKVIIYRPGKKTQAGDLKEYVELKGEKPLKDPFDQALAFILNDGWEPYNGYAVAGMGIAEKWFFRRKVES